MTSAKFDDYARSYDALHNQNLSSSGEPLEYFSAYKRACLERLGAPSGAPLLDYGCGIGNVTRALSEGFQDVHGYDPSAESLRVARERIPNATFHGSLESVPSAHFTPASMCRRSGNRPLPRAALLQGQCEIAVPLAASRSTSESLG